MAKVRVNSTGQKRDNSVVGQVKQFAVDSQRFLDKCQKPNKQGE